MWDFFLLEQSYKCVRNKKMNETHEEKPDENMEIFFRGRHSDRKDYACVLPINFLFSHTKMRKNESSC